MPETKIIFLASRDLDGMNSGWQPSGVWSVPPSLASNQQVLSMTPARSMLQTVQFSAVVADNTTTNPRQGLGVTNILINSAVDGRYGCFLAFTTPGGPIYLVDDVGTGATLLSAPSVSNSFCTINNAGTSVSDNGVQRTVNLNATFNSSWTGGKTAYVASRNAADNANSGWQAMATWMGSGGAGNVTPTGVVPSVGSGASQQFVFRYAYPYGLSDVDGGQILFNSDPNGPSGTNACQIEWTTSGSLNLLSSGGVATGSFGSAGILSNAFCSVDTAASTLTTSGNGYNVSVKVTFSNAFITAAPTHQLFALGRTKAQNLVMAGVPYTNIGSWNTGGVTGFAPGVTLIVAGVGSGTLCNVDDQFTLTISGGPPNSTVALSQNGLPAVVAGATDASGTFTASGTWVDGDIGVYSQTWYVAGVQSVPGLAFAVRGRLKCGTFLDTPNARYVQGATVEFTYINSNASSVEYRVRGANVNPYASNVTVPAPGPGAAFRTLFPTASLLGAYSVRAVPSAGNKVLDSCAREFLSVQTPGPPNPTIAICSSLTGTWRDSMPNVGTYVLTDTNGAITGTKTLDCCGRTYTYTVSGFFNEPNGNISLNTTNGSPSGTFVCPANGISYQAVNGLLGNGAPLLANNCGRVTGLTYTSSLGNNSNITLTTSVERYPSGETSASGGFVDGNGDPTVVAFRVGLHVASNGPAYNFAGRRVQQGNPSAGELVPPAYSASDTCWWSGAPYSAVPLLELGETTTTWEVQKSDPNLPTRMNGTYGVDYVGLSAQAVGYIQKRSPALSQNGATCSVRYPQIMSIRKETASPIGPASLRYGPVDPGYHLLKFDVSTSSITVTRGNETVTRTFSYPNN